MTEDPLDSLPLFPQKGSQGESGFPETEKSPPPRVDEPPPPKSEDPSPPRTAEPRLDKVEEPEADRPRVAGLGARLLAGGLDLSVVLAVLTSVVLGTSWMGVEVAREDWLAVSLFLLAFSFLYHAVPLSFWGQTPGMAVAGIVARTPTGQPLSFRQTALHWLGVLATVLALGLPALMALRGASFADRVSGSVTWIRPG